MQQIEQIQMQFSIACRFQNCKTIKKHNDTMTVLKSNFEQSENRKRYLT